MENIFEGFTVVNIDPGNNVLCDLCNTDYTNSNETGGFLFSRKAVCPECAPDFEKTVIICNEKRFITDRAMPNETFRDFVYRIRNS